MYIPTYFPDSACTSYYAPQLVIVGALALLAVYGLLFLLFKAAQQEMYLTKTKQLDKFAAWKDKR